MHAKMMGQHALQDSWRGAKDGLKTNAYHNDMLAIRTYQAYLIEPNQCDKQPYVCLSKCVPSDVSLAGENVLCSVQRGEQFIRCLQAEERAQRAAGDVIQGS